jgi:hypothetical protein
LLVYAAEVNTLGDEMNAMKGNMEASKEVRLEVNAGKTKYVLMYRHQNAGSYHKDS